MDRPKQSSRDGIAEDSLQEAITRISGGDELVAVRREHAPISDREGRGDETRVQPELSPEEVDEPEVVVPADEEERQPRFVRVRETGEDPDGAAGNRVAILEPEIEEVPEKGEPSEAVRSLIEKREKRALLARLLFLVRRAEV